MLLYEPSLFLRSQIVPVFEPELAEELKEANQSSRVIIYERLAKLLPL